MKIKPVNLAIVSDMKKKTYNHHQGLYGHISSYLLITNDLREGRTIIVIRQSRNFTTFPNMWHQAPEGDYFIYLRSCCKHYNYSTALCVTTTTQ